jgi:hypothetical protein
VARQDRVIGLRCNGWSVWIGDCDDCDTNPVISVGADGIDQAADHQPILVAALARLRRQLI